jgi:transposase-like protein
MHVTALIGRFRQNLAECRSEPSVIVGDDKLDAVHAHEGLKAAIRRVFGAGWQRWRVHWMRNALACVPKTRQSMVAAALRQAFLQPDRAQASAMLRHVADQLRQKWPKLAAFIDDSETEVLSYLDFPEQHRSKLHSTNPLERLCIHAYTLNSAHATTHPDNPTIP